MAMGSVWKSSPDTLASGHRFQVSLIRLRWTPTTFRRTRIFDWGYTAVAMEGTITRIFLTCEACIGGQTPRP
jgi:hypothetical protein